MGGPDRGRRGAGSPARGPASDCGAAGRCVITMARSLCPGAWLRKPYHLQVGRRPARRAPLARLPPPSPASARPKPAAPCRPAPGGAPSRLSAAVARAPAGLARGLGSPRPGSPRAPGIPRAPSRDPGAPLDVGAERGGLGTCLSAAGPAGRLCSALCPGS